MVSRVQVTAPDEPLARYSAVDRVFADADLRVRFVAYEAPGYEIHVGPRATKTALTIGVTGAIEFEIDADGSLVVSTAQGTVRHTPPVIVGEAGERGTQKLVRACRCVDGAHCLGGSGSRNSGRHRSDPRLLDVPRRNFE